MCQCECRLIGLKQKLLPEQQKPGCYVGIIQNNLAQQVPAKNRFKEPGTTPKTRIHQEGRHRPIIQGVDGTQLLAPDLDKSGQNKSDMKSS